MTPNSARSLGNVCGCRTDATAEPGVPLLFVFYNGPSHEKPVDYTE
jgi:hypothetical protein